MKQILTCLLLCSVVMPHIGSANEEPNEAIYQQLQAIVHYLQRTYDTTANEVLSAEETERVIVDSVDWILTSQEPSGHFEYEYLPFSDEYRSDDNAVRQAGTFFSLGEVARRSSTENPELQSAMKQAIAYFESLSPVDSATGEPLRCITNSAVSLRCYLGTTALALAGVLGYVEAYPEEKETYAPLIEDYKNYLMAAKKPETGFIANYLVETGFPNEIESPFFNGESMMALARYYQYNPDPAVEVVLKDTFAYLAAQEYESPLYLWIMMALKDMHPLFEDEAYLTYGSDFTKWRLTRSMRRHGTTNNYCAPTEGMVSAYSLLENSWSSEELHMFKTEIDYWNRRNLHWQIDAGEYYWLSLDEEPRLLKVINMGIAQGGFLTSESVLTQRIDFTQHCLSAYVQTHVDIHQHEL